MWPAPMISASKGSGAMGMHWYIAPLTRAHHLAATASERLPVAPNAPPRRRVPPARRRTAAAKSP
ncbi:hypothetical protein XAP412_960095 [Xanthomonas phaseoli pv. phaseoli]|nr:hypothetical protein XAP412_960095 [Xanthomonas phaseoli pv. phaseoli]